MTQRLNPSGPPRATTRDHTSHLGPCGEDRAITREIALPSPQGLISPVLSLVVALGGGLDFREPLYQSPDTSSTLFQRKASRFRYKDYANEEKAFQTFTGSPGHLACRVIAGSTMSVSSFQTFTGSPGHLATTLFSLS